jgi:hypothetical protein
LFRDFLVGQELSDLQDRYLKHIFQDQSHFFQMSRLGITTFFV